MREKFGKRSIGFFLVFFCEIEISFLQLIKNLTYVAFGGCSNFTFLRYEARGAAVQV